MPEDWDDEDLEADDRVESGEDSSALFREGHEPEDENLADDESDELPDESALGDDEEMASEDAGDRDDPFSDLTEGSGAEPDGVEDRDGPPSEADTAGAGAEERVTPVSATAQDGSGPDDETGDGTDGPESEGEDAEASQEGQGLKDSGGEHVDVRAREVHSGGNTMIVGTMEGDVTTIENINTRDRGSFHRVDWAEWQAFEATFVASTGCRDRTEERGAFDEGPVLIVRGAEGCGKGAASLYLAVKNGDLGPTRSNVVRYVPPVDGEAPSLRELLSSEEIPKPGLLIFENSFDRGVSITDLEGLDLNSLVSSLDEEPRKRLILTTTRDPQDLPRAVPAVCAELNQEELKEVRRLAIEYAWPRGGRIPAAIRQLIETEWASLVQNLKRPLHIHDFCQLVAASDSAAVDSGEKLVNVAAEMVRPGPWALTEWFGGLEPNEKLMAFLIVFFPGLTAADLMMLYVLAVRWLRADGVGFLEDPRNLGVDDLLYRIKARPNEDPIRLERSHRDFVARQVANHRHLLQSLTELLLRDFDKVPGVDGLQLRQGIGSLLGHLGGYDVGWLGERLDALARSESWQRNTVACYALTRVAAEDLRTRSELSIRIAEPWAKGDRRCRWTAGATSWRIFELIASREADFDPEVAARLRHEAIRTLQVIATERWDRPSEQLAWGIARELARSRDKREIAERARQLRVSWQAEPVVFALRRLLDTNPEGVIPYLASWLSDRRLRSLAMWACEQAAEQNAPIARVAGSLAMALLQNVSPESERLREIFKALQVRDDKDFADTFRGLLSLCNDGGELRRSRLRRVLAEAWIDSAEARRHAARLVARSHAMDGRFVSPGRVGQALIVLDPSIPIDWRQGQLVDSKPGRSRRKVAPEARAVQHLASLLGAHFELRFGVLGRVQVWRPEQPLPRSPRHASRLRLLMPLLEALSRLETTAGYRPDLIAVVAAGPVIDLHDLPDSRVADRVITVALGGAAIGGSDGALAGEAQETDAHEAIEGRVAWRLEGAFTERRMAELEDAIEQAWRRTRTAARTDDPEPSAPSVGLEPAMAAAEREAILAQWCERIDDPELANGVGDLVHALCAAIVAWAAEDLEGCVDLLTRWLGPERAEDAEAGSAESRRSRIAAAATKALYRLHAGTELGPGDASLARLFDDLAWPLSLYDPDGTATVLRAVEGWLQDAGWREHLGGVEGGQSRLLRWATRFLIGRQDLAGLVGSALPEGPGREMLADVLETFGGGPRYRAWPPLSSAQRRALLVPESLSAEGVGGLALGLARRFSRDVPDIVPTVVRLGEVRPIWVPTAEAWLEERASPQRLLVPLLESMELDPDQVAFVLVLTSGTILDEADLLHSPWWRKVLVYRVVPPREPVALRWLEAWSGGGQVARREEEDRLFESLMDALARPEGLAMEGSLLEPN